MFWIIFTVICYTISSLGDKYISSNLSFNEKELWKVEMLFLSIFLIVGIAMILKEKKEVMNLLLYILGFVMPKLLYYLS